MFDSIKNANVLTVMPEDLYLFFVIMAMFCFVGCGLCILGAMLESRHIRKPKKLDKKMAEYLETVDRR
jgi:hypothetical protein